MSFLKVGLVFAMVLTMSGDVGRASEELDGENEKTARAVIPQSNASNDVTTLKGGHVARRPVALSARFARATPDTLSYDLAALYDEDPYNIRRGNGDFYIGGTATLYGSLLWGTE
ncbi:MAG: hypothetical protein K2Q34_06415 [Alphaproteobacteria bacterium]|nr:hypothetical protein [Alphaproteobacteria bacterium]